MIRFILAKLLYLVPTFLGITIIAFGFVRILPGDPVLLMAGERGVTPERHAELSAQLGYDKSLVLQYFDFLGRLMHGDLGNSLVTKKPVLTEFLALFPATVELGLFAIILATVIGVPVGVLAAIKRGSWFDQISMTTALVGFSMPIFWWGLLLIILFSGILGWTPVSGRISLMFFFPNVTGFMLIDSLLSGQKG
ncbi:MAG: ABC transporter permease subunit, partial [Paracoccaceae bacterium]